MTWAQLGMLVDVDPEMGEAPVEAPLSGAELEAASSAMARRFGVNDG